MTPPPPSSPFKDDCLHGRVALITGGGSGICFEIAKQFLLHGCRGVMICGRRENFLQRASDALNSEAAATATSSSSSSSPPFCVYKTCDVRDPAQCKAAVEHAVSTYGQLDILVNGAAGNFLSEASMLTPKGFRTVMEIDAHGTFHMCHAAYPYLKRSTMTKTNGGGTGAAVGACIINISMTLHYGATWFQAHASAAKSAVDSLTRSLALEWGASNIRVNGIAPGPIANTPGTTKLGPGMDSSDVEDVVKEGVPLQRMGESFDVAMAAVFLCSDGGSFITGDTLVVDGAHWLYKPPMVPREMVAELSRSVEAKSRAQTPRLASKL